MKAVIAIVVGMSFSLASWARESDGPSSGGGGMVVTCKSAAGAITSTELLDVYEAKVRKPGQVIASSGDITEDYLKLAVNTYSLQGYSLAEARTMPAEIVKNVRNFMDIVDWSGALPFLNDQGKYEALPAGCELEQLAIFSDLTGRVRVDQAIWDRLDSLSKAAFIQHEIFYVEERTRRELTSESTRSIVAQQLAASGYTPVQFGLEKAQRHCLATTPPVVVSGTSTNSELTEFYVFTKGELGKESTTLQFKSINGRSLLVKTEIELPNFLLSTRAEYNRKFDEFFPLEFPNSSTAHKVFQVPVKTEHRSDWELKLEYIGGQPIRLTLIQDGVAQSSSTLDSCEDL